MKVAEFCGGRLGGLGERMGEVGDLDVFCIDGG